MTLSFKPGSIYVDEAVLPLPMTRKILDFYKNIPVEIVTDPKNFKKPSDITWAKKGLMLARYKADLPLKPFSAMQTSAGRPHYSLSLISNCHLECTYCILQSYLANNPLITIYTNIEEVLEKLSAQLATLPAHAVIGTGKIADSLALEPMTGLAKELISFFARQNHGTILELKTKSDHVDDILNCDHNGKTVVSWSMNPQKIVEREEYKTASVAERLQAAKKCVSAGFQIGFHFDPMIWHEGWQKNYRVLAEQIFNAVAPEKIAWMSLGTLRFPNRQKKIIEKRFPKNQKLFDGLKHSHLPYLAYAPALRKEMLETAAGYIKERAPEINLYYCMEEDVILSPKGAKDPNGFFGSASE